MGEVGGLRDEVAFLRELVYLCCSHKQTNGPLVVLGWVMFGGGYLGGFMHGWPPFAENVATWLPLLLWKGEGRCDLMVCFVDVQREIENNLMEFFSFSRVESREFVA